MKRIDVVLLDYSLPAGEFLEGPGLCLTCQQAQRLWGLDERACMDLLAFGQKHHSLV